MVCLGWRLGDEERAGKAQWLISRHWRGFQGVGGVCDQASNGWHRYQGALFQILNVKLSLQQDSYIQAPI